MRILVSNPDNIGDFVLRQPMYAALAAAGHQLLLALRSFVAPIAPLVAPNARTILLESDPYSPVFDPASADVRHVLDAAREFAPEICCIAPYQRTEFDELLAESLNGCRKVGMAGLLYPGDINAGLNRQSRLQLDHAVPVSADQHELEKNEQLCGALLGRRVKLPDPAIQADHSDTENARSIITRLGLRPGKFWIACVGSHQFTAVKNWPLENWAKALSHAVTRHGTHFIMIGTPDEGAATEQVRTLMGTSADATENLCDSPQPLGTTVGLIELSAGYLGRDTGPMHLAAALGKPVIAPIGAGHWPRFTPKAKVGAVACLVMPCAGCNWICHLSESYCVSRVPLEFILDAFDGVQNGTLAGVQIQQLQMDPMLSARIIRESSASFRDLRRRLAAAEIQISDAAGRAAAELADQLARTNAERDHLEAQLRSERNKAQSARRDAEKIHNQGAEERQSILDVLNDLVIEHTDLKQSSDREARETAEALRGRDEVIADYRVRLDEATAALKEQRESISFRVLVAAGRPVMALQRMLRSLLRRREKKN